MRYIAFVQRGFQEILRFCYRLIFLPLLSSLDFLLFLIPPKQGSNKKNILLVRLDNIGDYILWLESAKEIRKIYSPEEYIITLVGNRTWAEFAINSPYFDKVIPIYVSTFNWNIFYRMKKLADARKIKYDTVIHPAYSRHQFFFNAEAFIRIVCAKNKIGFSGQSIKNVFRKTAKSLGSIFYTFLIDVPGNLVSELEINAEFIKKLGSADFKAKVPILETSYFPKIKRANLDNFDIQKEKYYVLFISASYPLKKWPYTNFLKIADLFYKEKKWTGVVCGGKKDIKKAAYLTKKTSVPLINFVGKTSLIELAFIIKYAKIIITNDTSAAHIAPACRTPSICLAGGGQFGRFIPYPAIEPTNILPVTITNKMACFNCNWDCIYKHSLERDQAAPCVSKIGVRDTWDAILNTINS